MASPIGRPFGCALGAHDQRSLLQDALVVVDQLRHLLQDLQVSARARLGEHLSRTGAHLRRQPFDQGRVVDARVPDREVAQARVSTHAVAVGGDRRMGGAPLLAAARPDVPLGHDRAGDQPLQIPLPGAGMGFIEVVDAEHQAALGRRIDTEVAQVHVAASLHEQTGTRRSREVGRHDAGGAAQERERRHQHARVAHRDERSQAAARLLAQHRNDIPRWRIDRGKLGVRSPRRRVAQCLALRHALVHRSLGRMACNWLCPPGRLAYARARHRRDRFTSQASRSCRRPRVARDPRGRVIRVDNPLGPAGRPSGLPSNEAVPERTASLARARRGDRVRRKVRYSRACPALQSPFTNPAWICGSTKSSASPCAISKVCRNGPPGVFCARRSPKGPLVSGTRKMLPPVASASATEKSAGRPARQRPDMSLASHRVGAET
jgi:hypothetical protein